MADQPTLPDLPGGQRTVGGHYVAEPAGLLFDCDGTLIDTMPLFYYSWEDTAPSFGLSFTRADFYAVAGMPLPAIIEKLHREQKGSDPPEAFVSDFLAAKKAAHKVQEEKRGAPPPIACVVQLARDAVSQGIPICLATSGLRDHVEAHLKHAGLDDLFSSEKGNLVVAADVPKGKPAPDIFIEAARRIGVDPAACRAYEDGESGLRSAYAAGCHVIDVTFMDSYPMVEELRQAKIIDEAKRDWLV